MDFGVCLTGNRDTCGRQAQLAESLGFSHIWIPDNGEMDASIQVERLAKEMDGCERQMSLDQPCAKS
jgi:hypothetical protein